MRESRSVFSLIDPKIDFTVKQIFAGDRIESKIVLIAFLNAVLEAENEIVITDIVYLNPYTEKNHLDNKQSILGIKVKTQAKEYIDIEMRVRNIDHYRKRSLYYTLYGEQISESDAYYNFKKYIVINLLNFNLLQETEAYHSIFRAKDMGRGCELIDNLEIHYLELPKLKAIEQLTTLEEWLFFIRDAGKEEKHDLLNQIKQKNEMIDLADDILHQVSQNEYARVTYQEHWKCHLNRFSSEQYYIETRDGKR